MKGYYRWLIYVIIGLCWYSGRAQSVRITNVQSIKRPHASDIPLHYQPKDSVVYISYNTNNLVISLETTDDKPRYKYRVERFLSQYVITKDTFVLLPNLPNGELLFEVWNINQKESPPARLKIIVESPLWLRWWFLPLMFIYGMLFVGAGLYLLYRYRLRQFLRLQRVRDRIARDLHDDMGSYLSSISILSQTASRSVAKDPAKAQATLDRIGQTARHVMDSMGDIVWSINPDHDSMKQVVSRMTDVASSLFTETNEATRPVNVAVDVADDVCEMSLSAERRRDFFLIYKEAITNAARYANASRIRIQLRLESGQLVLVVEDDGDGFDPENPERKNPAGGNGLLNMKKRAELLGGVLLLRSRVGEGTTLTVKFPY